MDTIIEWAKKFWGYVADFGTWILEGCVLLLQFVFYTLIDGIFVVIESFLAMLDFSAILFNYASTWSGLPPQLVWLITAAGLPQAFALLGGAWVLRLLLNLIPAALTRV